MSDQEKPTEGRALDARCAASIGTDALGPLPQPVHGFYGAPMYTADQVRVYALQERAAERERCAQLCEHEAAMWRGQQDISDFLLCAAVIRRADSEHSARVLLPPIGSGTQAALQVADERRGLSDERVLMIGRRAVDKCPGSEAQHLYIAREVERAHGIAR